MIENGGVLEGGPRPVSYSELDTFRQCPLKWHLGYREGWKPTVEKEAFRLGHVWHEIMETHYTVIKDFQASGRRSPARGSVDEATLLDTCWGAVDATIFKRLDQETLALMVWAYKGYLDAYGCDPDIRIIATEQRGETQLPGTSRKLVWVIDLVVEDLVYGGQWIWDHKFPADLASDFEIDLDDQLGLYWWGWMASGSPLAKRVNGALLNESRKKQNAGDREPREFFKNGKPKGTPQTLEQRFRRTRTSRTQIELKNLAEDAVQVVRAMDQGIIYSSPNPKQCSWKCDFKEVHTISRSGQIPIEEVLEDFGFTSRAQREESYPVAVASAVKE